MRVPLRVCAAVRRSRGFAAPVSAGTGSELSGVIKQTEELRGLSTTHPLAVSTLGAAGIRRVVVRELAREHEPLSDGAWNDALHLLGVLHAGQSLAAVQGQALSGQVAGLYVPHSRRLYVLGARGAAPRSVIAHEVVHALQDEHFELTRGAFAPRPRDHDGELAAQALVEGDATEVQTRYVATLSPGDLVKELARTLGAVPAGSPRRCRRICSGSSCIRTRRVRRSCAPCGRAAGNACSIAPFATRRAPARRCSIRPATWPAIRLRAACPCRPGATASRPRSAPRTSPR